MSAKPSSTTEDDVPTDYTPPQHEQRPAPTDQSPVSIVQIDALVLGDSPRLSGEDPEHTRMLAETNSVLPPIAVHRPTMRVIDGMHRIRAALLRGEDKIAARLYDCSENHAFVLAVQANITHGLPLSLADRKAAAARIIKFHPSWSNRTVAESTGLSDKTVSAIRQRSTSEIPQSNTRIGRDGRGRPLNSASKRQRAAELIKARPDAGLREIAWASGLSLATASDVRERVRRNEDPVPLKYRNVARSTGLASPKTASAKVAPTKSASAKMNSSSGKRSLKAKRDQQSTLQILRNDPSLKLNETGRRILRWLHQHVIDAEDWEKLIDSVPSHCTKVMAELARECADVWGTFAHELEQRTGAADS